MAKELATFGGGDDLLRSAATFKPNVSIEEQKRPTQFDVLIKLQNSNLGSSYEKYATLRNHPILVDIAPTVTGNDSL